MTFTKIKYAFSFSLIFLELLGCKQKQPVTINKETIANEAVSLKVERGGKIYNSLCVPCHNYHGYNTDYHPALNEYIMMNKDTVLKKIKVLETDSLHRRLLTSDQIDTLRQFLIRYDGISY
jgi:hypothetical protein